MKIQKSDWEIIINGENQLVIISKEIFISYKLKRFQNNSNCISGT